MFSADQENLPSLDLLRDYFPLTAVDVMDGWGMS